jgi:formamidopyrimidine-DNA glycosylase
MPTRFCGARGSRPSPQAIKLPEDKIKDLVKSIHSVLKDAEKQILQSNPDIINGEVRDFMLIHNAKKKHSPKGAPILIKEAGRKTYYTEEQVLYS